MTNIAGREVRTPDLVLMGTGVVGLINSFLPWYRADASDFRDLDDLGDLRKAVDFFGSGSGSGDHVSVNGWSAGVLSLFATLLLLAVAVLVALKVFGVFKLQAVGTYGPAFILLALSGLGLVFVVLKLLVDHSWIYFGLWIGLILAVVQVFFVFGEFKTSGEKLPDLPKGGPAAGTPPQA
jgi:amino acid transporter